MLTVSVQRPSDIEQKLPILPTCFLISEVKWNQCMALPLQTCVSGTIAFEMTKHASPSEVQLHYLLVCLYYLKIELRISEFQHFHWLAGHRLSAHIPALTNMVNELISKRKLDKNFPSKPAAIKNRLAAELTSRNSDTGHKYKWNSPLHCSECFKMTKTNVIIVIQKFFS